MILKPMHEFTKNVCQFGYWMKEIWNNVVCHLDMNQLHRQRETPINTLSTVMTFGG